MVSKKCSAGCGIDVINRAYCTVAQWRWANERGTRSRRRCGSRPRTCHGCRPSVLRAAESDSRPARLRRVRRGSVRTVLCRRGPTGPAAGPLLPLAADRLFRRLGRRACHCVACRGRRTWKKKAEACAAVYRNRRRIRGARGRRLLRLRGERLERPFAHLTRRAACAACTCAGTRTF